MKILSVFLLGFCLLVNGCGKSESPLKKDAAAESDALTVAEADILLAEAADPLMMHDRREDVPVAAQESPSDGLPAAAGNTPDKKAIQRALKTLGFYQGALDGKFGRKTEAAVREFQGAHKLMVDGKVGPKTWAALQSAVARTAASATGSEKRQP